MATIQNLTIDQDADFTQTLTIKDSAGDVVKVYGRIGTTSGTFFNASDFTQIGDDITVSGTTSVLKSIATTGLNWCGVTVTPATGSDNITYAMLRQA